MGIAGGSPGRGWSWGIGGNPSVGFLWSGGILGEGLTILLLSAS